jgi:XTP/dITP diphosphohydrolase
LHEPEETGTSFAENAILKATLAAKAADRVALADDSGLCVTALNNRPGIYSARYALSPEALAQGGGPPTYAKASGDKSKNFAFAMKRLHDELGGALDRSAHFICVLALAWPDGHAEIFEGRVDGHLVWPPRGDSGHGYDPIFVPTGHDRTFGEMDGDEKNAISHRAIAVHKLITRLRN